MRIQVDTRRPLLILLIGMSALCWAALLLWSLSPYERYLGHEVLEGVAFRPGGEYLSLLAIFILGWTLMTMAMMLPTSLPLIVLFQRFTRQQEHPPRLMGLLIAGYLAVWIAFGVVAHGADLFVHQWVEQIQWLGENEWAISVLVLAGAGIYQFMPLKYACLGKCRSPLSFIVEHWRGQHPQSEALLLGVRHGLFCVGCCWSLMLLMFAIASGSIVWMLLLGAIMAVEKNVSWGKRIGAPLGVALLLGSTGLVLGALINI